MAIAFDDVRRTYDGMEERAGRVYIIPPEEVGKPVGPDGPKEKLYTRCTTWIDTLTSAFALMRWEERKILAGLAARPDLMVSVGAFLDDVKELDGVIQKAKVAGKADESSGQGTAMHKVYEDLDRGKPIEPILARIPKELHDDVLSRQRLVEGLRWNMIEGRVVLDTFKVTGTPDRIGTFPARHPRFKGLTFPDGRPISGKTVVVDDKGLALDTPLPTPTGWTTMGEVQVGDQVLDAYGRPCAVLRKSATKRIGTYLVRFNDGSEIVCDAEHLWWTQKVYTAESRKAAPTVKPIADLVGDLLSPAGQRWHRVPVAKPLVLPEAKLAMDPYLLGCWLGDGSTNRSSITKERELFDILKADGVALGKEQPDKRAPHVITHQILGGLPVLKTLGVLGHKHIPPEYLRASTPQRIRLAQGMLDTDGSWNFTRKTVEWVTTSPDLARDMEELLLTLGQKPNVNKRQQTGFGKTVTAWKIAFTPCEIQPFRLPRKADKVIPRNAARSGWRLITSIEPGPDVETACIAVDSDTRTYLCGRRMVPTHNTGKIEDYNIGKVAMQLAVYARSWNYDRKTGERTPHGADTMWGLVIHNPVGGGVAKFMWVDLTKGWQGVQLCRSVRDYRNLGKKQLCHDFEPPRGETPAAPSVHKPAPHVVAARETGAQIIEELHAATTVEELHGIYELHLADWSDFLGQVATERREAIEAGTR